MGHEKTSRYCGYLHPQLSIIITILDYKSQEIKFMPDQGSILSMLFSLWNPDEGISNNAYGALLNKIISGHSMVKSCLIHLPKNLREIETTREIYL